MLDINLFRQDKGGNPELIRESQRRRFADVAIVDEIIALDLEWRRGFHVSMSVPRFPARDNLVSLPWRLPLFSSLEPVNTDAGNNRYPLYSFRVVPSPSANADSHASADSTANSSRYLTRDTIANAAAEVGPAVVNLSVPKGMRVSSKGKVEVTLQDGRTFEGKVLNADLHSDIAIIKIDSKLPLPAAKLGSSSTLRPGEWVVAMGCPLSLQNTVTAGIISCVDRKSSDLGLGGMRREYLQTDCAINAVTPGSPGDRAGFRPGDVVTEFDGKPVGSIKEIIDIMDDKVGKPLKVVVKRANNASAILTVIPEEANPDM